MKHKIFFIGLLCSLFFLPEILESILFIVLHCGFRVHVARITFSHQLCYQVL